MKKTEKVFTLRNLKFKESDLIVYCLNHQGAKLVFIAKGARKSQKRFGGGVLDPAQYIQITYTPPQKQTNSNFNGILNEAEIIEPFSGLRTEYERISLGLYFVKLMEKISREGVVDDNKNFQLLGNALKAAEIGEDKIKLRTHFLIKFLYHQGVLRDHSPLGAFLNQPLIKSDDIEISQSDLNQLILKIDQQAQNFMNGG